MSGVLLAVCLGLGALVLFIGIRNERVYRYRTRLLKAASEAAKVDIAEGREWRWRYDVYDHVGYQTMVWHFWRPLDSFYPNHAFINAKAEGREP